MMGVEFLMSLGVSTMTTQRKRLPRSQDPKAYKRTDLLRELHTKSAAVRYLNAQGLSRAQIADVLDIRYQHVRNVLLMPLTKKNPPV